MANSCSKAKERLKYDFKSKSDSISTLFETYDDGLGIVSDEAQRTGLQHKFEDLHKNVIKMINKLKENALSELAERYPIKCESDLCGDEFSILQ